MTYGDMMSLLLAFFVIIVAMSEIKEEEKFLEVMQSIRTAFGYVGGMGTVPTNNPPEVSMLKRLENIVIPQRIKEVSESDEKGIEGKRFRVTEVHDGVEIQIGGSLAFDRFQAELKPEAVEKLALLAEQLKGTNNKIEIRGHATLELLPPDSPFKDQRHLSYARAEAIGVILAEMGLRDRRFTYVAVGTSEPMKSQAYDEDRLAKNRRVEIIVKESLVSDYEGEPISFEESENDAQ